MTLDEAIRTALEPALGLLPVQMDTPEARVMVLAICLQESRFEHRWQVLDGGRKGPARGFPQFERGTRQSKGGVWGVVLHPASRYWLHWLCETQGVKFEAAEIWRAIETDDVLALGLARLLLFTDPRRLPPLDDAAGAWRYYLRNWRPGRRHPRTWAAHHRAAVEAVTGGAP